MYKESNKVKLAYKFCKKMTADYDESHDFCHHMRVLHNFHKILANAEDIILSDEEEEMLEVAILVHDIVDYKYLTKNDPKIQKLKDFLRSIYNPMQVNRILLWVNNSSWSKEKKKGYLDVPAKEQLCTRLLADADRLDAIAIEYDDWYWYELEMGPDLTYQEPLAITRCLAYISHKFPNITEAEKEQKLMEHAKEKLLLLHKDIHTPPAKSLAQTCTLYLIMYLRSKLFPSILPLFLKI